MLKTVPVGKLIHVNANRPKSERIKTIEAADAIISKMVADAKFPVNQGLENLEVRAAAMQVGLHKCFNLRGLVK
jgi:hypothetical protein